MSEAWKCATIFYSERTQGAMHPHPETSVSAYKRPRWDGTRGCIFFFHARRTPVCDIIYLPAAPACSGLQADFPECTLKPWLGRTWDAWEPALFFHSETLVCDPSHTQRQHLLLSVLTKHCAYCVTRDWQQHRILVNMVRHRLNHPFLCSLLNVFCCKWWLAQFYIIVRVLSFLSHPHSGCERCYTLWITKITSFFT